MGESAERMAKENGISRADQDAWALRSHELAAAGTEDGRLTSEIAPVYVPPRFEDVITSDVFPVPGVDRVIDARDLPFEDERLKAIVMTNVFHHIPDVAPFLTEAQRALRPGGRIVMVEPWNTGWSKFLHESFHNEPMVVDAPDWAFPDSGPLSAANAALAWVVCERDRAVLNRDWPHLQVTRVEPFMPFRYVLSGGVSLRSLQPGWMYPFWNWADNLPFLKHRMAVFALIVIERNR